MVRSHSRAYPRGWSVLPLKSSDPPAHLVRRFAGLANSASALLRWIAERSCSRYPSGWAGGARWDSCFEQSEEVFFPIAAALAAPVSAVAPENLHEQAPSFRLATVSVEHRGARLLLL